MSEGFGDSFFEALYKQGALPKVKRLQAELDALKRNNQYCPMCGSGTVSSVPDGWQLVPVEPSHETIIEIAQHVAAAITYAEAKAIYGAVLASAPKPGDPT